MSPRLCYHNDVPMTVLKIKEFSENCNELPQPHYSTVNLPYDYNATQHAHQIVMAVGDVHIAANNQRQRLHEQNHISTLYKSCPDYIQSHAMNPREAVVHHSTDINQANDAIITLISDSNLNKAVAVQKQTDGKTVWQIMGLDAKNKPITYTDVFRSKDVTFETPYLESALNILDITEKKRTAARYLSYKKNSSLEFYLELLALQADNSAARFYIQEFESLQFPEHEDGYNEKNYYKNASPVRLHHKPVIAKLPRIAFLPR